MCVYDERATLNESLYKLLYVYLHTMCACVEATASMHTIFVLTMQKIYIKL